MRRRGIPHVRPTPYRGSADPISFRQIGILDEKIHRYLPPFQIYYWRVRGNYLLPILRITYLVTGFHQMAALTPKHFSMEDLPESRQVDRRNVSELHGGDHLNPKA